MITRYRADIDGLRAVAVSSVLLFHAEVPGFGGGFVGVDIFFVISGFLITSIIVGDVERGDFSIARFYERRVRRIFPAFFAMLLAVLLAGMFLHDALEFARLGKNAIAATIFISNIAFWREAGYFAPSAETNPLLHTWSLSVEEQFYLFFPLLVALLALRAPKTLRPCLLVGTVLSVALASWGAFRFPGATFYLLPTRAWELSMGSLLALGVPGAPRSSSRAAWGALIGLALIGISIMTYSERTPFPGLAALPPVVGASLMVWSGLNGRDTQCGRVLSWRPVVFVGLISYSLYLWHWPIIAIWKYVVFRPMGWSDSLIIVALSIALGAASWRFIERPFRHGNGLVRERRGVFVLGSLAMLVAVGAGGWIWGSGGLPGRFDASAHHIAVVDRARDSSAWDMYAGWEHLTESLGASPQTQPPIVGRPGATPKFAFVGDSHARALIPAIEAQAERVGVSGYIITRRSTPPLSGIGVKQIPHGDDGFDEAQYHERLIKFLEDVPQVHTVILAGRWPAYIRDHYTERGEDQLDCELIDASGTATDIPTRSALLERGLDRLVERLSRMDRRVVLVGCVPEIGVDVPTAYGIASRLPWLLDLQTIGPTREEFQHRQMESRELLSNIATRYRASFVEPDSVLWGADGRATILVGDELLYRDDDHLSDAGARHVAPCLDGVFDSLARVKDSGK